MPHSIPSKKFSQSIGATLSAIAITLTTATSAFAAQDVYFGTGNKQGDGIYHATFDETSGHLSAATRVADIDAPGFLAKHPKRDVIYAVAVAEDVPVVAAYKKAQDSSLVFINSVAIGDGSGTHISVHPSGKFLITAQYGGGSVAVFSLGEDGEIVERTQLIEHQGGSKVYKNRQDSPHPHWVGFSPDGEYAVVPDLGLDAAIIYEVNESEYTLTHHGEAVTVAGGGPRHMRFSVDGERIFLLNEFTLSISTFDYDAAKGTAQRVSVTPTLSEATKSQEAFNSASEILVHPNGEFVYSANRGHDSVSVFTLDDDGALSLLENEHVRGAFPRNINLDLSGKWLFAAGQHSNTVSVFAIDQSSGLLQYQTGNTINVPEPICILFDE
ncbi:lactonase family protein [Alteromonas sp. KUL49]|uniref:lactonase family protein n=1 Tax=Alteromonas sp. KUL49 TaxID=2480798 RepID=UPI00102EF6A7|nr:lactonase family protein [Alteromonas sp. KUL49]TAP42269.1 lactonase family protein [Alteromonas sp. KUL49]GEA09863.1 3-carboxymuconate cyclase [Alteromonas sp. KUL49]